MSKKHKTVKVNGARRYDIRVQHLVCSDNSFMLDVSAQINYPATRKYSYDEALRISVKLGEYVTQFMTDDSLLNAIMNNESVVIAGDNDYE